MLHCATPRDEIGVRVDVNVKRTVRTSSSTPWCVNIDTEWRFHDSSLRGVTVTVCVSSLSGAVKRTGFCFDVLEEILIVDSAKARDIIAELKPRTACGSTLVLRVGRRAWERPRVAVSNRLYKLYRLADPWDPNTKGTDTPIGLGPVSLRLGAKKRQPAPHLQPKKEKKKVQKGVPDALRSKLERSVPPVARAKTEPAKSQVGRQSAKQADADRAAEVAARMKAAEQARSWPRRTTSSTDTQPNIRAPALPVRPDIDVARQEVAEVEASPKQRTKMDRVLKRGGRFRMKPTETSRAPVVRSVASTSGREPSPVDTEETSAPPPRTRVMPSLGGGMDDLFGAAAQLGRVSMRSSSAAPEEE